MQKIFLQGMVMCLFFSESFSTPIIDTIHSYTDTLEFVSRKGPRNADTLNYATLYFMRPPGSVSESKWFAVLINDDILVKADNNCRYKIRIQKEGPLRLWTDGDQGKSILNLDVKYHKNYYVSLTITPGIKYGNSVLEELDSAVGTPLYNSITDKENVFNNPFFINRNSEFAKLRAYHVDDPYNRLQLGLMSFLPPVSVEYYYADASAYMFNYRNIFLSNSFSEVVSMQLKEIGKLDTQEDLLKFIKKQIKDGKALTSGKEKLVSLSYEPFTGTNYNGWMVHYELNDMDAPNRGNAKFLVIRETDGWFYKKTGGKKDILTQIFFSERGLPEEVHLPEEIRFKAFHFIKNVKFTD